MSESEQWPVERWLRRVARFFFGMIEDAICGVFDGVRRIIEHAEQALARLGVPVSDAVLAWFGAQAIRQALGQSMPLAVAVGFAMEAGSILLSQVPQEMSHFNQTRSRAKLEDGKTWAEPPAPAGIAWTVFIVQTIFNLGLVALNVLPAGLTAWGLRIESFAMATVAVLSVTATFSASQSRYIRQRYEDRDKRQAEEKAERERAAAEVKEEQLRTEHREDLAARRAARLQRKAQVAATLPQGLAQEDKRAAMLDILRKDGHATSQDIAAALHITRQAVDGRFKTLEKQGVIQPANGDGWKVLA